MLLLLNCPKPDIVNTEPGCTNGRLSWMSFSVRRNELERQFVVIWWVVMSIQWGNIIKNKKINSLSLSVNYFLIVPGNSDSIATICYRALCCHPILVFKTFSQLCDCVSAPCRIITSWHPWSWRSDSEKHSSSKRWMELNLCCTHCWGGTSLHRVRIHSQNHSHSKLVGVK